MHAWSDEYHYTSRFVPQAQWLYSLQVTVAELVVVRHITATQASGFNGNLEFTRTRVCNRPSFLFVMSGFRRRLPCEHPTNSGKRGMVNGTARLRVLDPVVHAGHLRLQSRTLGIA